MPKMKTNSSAKKRFSFTASNKVRGTQAGKRHGMRKRSASQIREHRGTTIVADADSADFYGRVFPAAVTKRVTKPATKPW